MTAVIRAIQAAVVLALFVACSAPSNLARAAEAVKAARSPTIDRVIYREANFLDPEELIVYLPFGATPDAAAVVWCTALVPAGLTDTNTTLWNAAGMRSFPMPARCG